MSRESGAASTLRLTTKYLVVALAGEMVVRTEDYWLGRKHHAAIGNFRAVQRTKYIEAALPLQAHHAALGHQKLRTAHYTTHSLLLPHVRHLLSFLHPSA